MAVETNTYLETLEKSLYDLVTETSTNLPKDVRRAIKAAKEAENAGTAVVQTGNKDPLRMRQKPSTKGRIMDQLSNGTEVEIIEVQEEWVKIRVNGKEGYVMIQYLDDVTQEQQEDADE